MENLEAKINGFEDDAQSRAAAEIAASEAIAAAKKHQDGATDDFIAADNVLLEATTAIDAAREEEIASGRTAAELKASLETAKAQLAQVKSLIDSFEASRAGPPSATTAPAEGASAEVDAEPAALAEASPQAAALPEVTSEPVSLAP